MSQRVQNSVGELKYIYTKETDSSAAMARISAQETMLVHNIKSSGWVEIRKGCFLAIYSIDTGASVQQN